jgi:hypothetical protein
MQIREREPVFEPPPVLLIDVKLDADWVPRPEMDLPDFALRSEVVCLMEHLDQLGSTAIECLEVRAGVPRRLIFRSPLEKVPRDSPAHSPEMATRRAKGRFE